MFPYNAVFTFYMFYKICTVYRAVLFNTVLFLCVHAAFYGAVNEILL